MVYNQWYLSNYLNRFIGDGDRPPADESKSSRATVRSPWVSTNAQVSQSGRVAAR